MPNGPDADPTGEGARRQPDERVSLEGAGDANGLGGCGEGMAGREHSPPQVGQSGRANDQHQPGAGAEGEARQSSGGGDSPLRIVEGGSELGGGQQPNRGRIGRRVARQPKGRGTSRAGVGAIPVDDQSDTQQGGDGGGDPWADLGNGAGFFDIPVGRAGDLDAAEALSDPAAFLVRGDKEGFVEECASWKELTISPPKPGVVAWAENNLRLSERFTNLPGTYSTSRTPYVREVLECFADEQVRRLALVWGAQTSKSTILTIGMAYRVAKRCEVKATLFLEQARHLVPKAERPKIFVILL